MKQVRLSLGIPVYNQAATIVETIESVLAQSEPFDNLVVVDNHSTDGTTERLQPYKDRVSIVRPPHHLGMVENWNFCVSQMDGDWFSLLSGDDLLKPSFASAVRAAAQAHPTAALIRTDWDVIDGASVVRSVHRQLSVSRITAPPNTWQEQLNGPKVSFAAFSARRDLWAQVGGFPKHFHLFQDWMFWLKLAPHGPFIRVPETLAQYRSHERPELENKRASLRLLDEHRYTTDVLPSLPWSGNRSERQLLKVRQSRLRDLLNYLVQYRSVSDDPAHQAKLAAMADLAKMQVTYAAWLMAPSFIHPPWGDRLLNQAKHRLRRVLSKKST